MEKFNVIINSTDMWKLKDVSKELKRTLEKMSFNSGIGSKAIKIKVLVAISKMRD